MKKIFQERASAIALPKRSKQIHKQSRAVLARAVAPTLPTELPNVYDILEQCSDMHKVLLKSQQILNDVMREIEDMDVQLEGARNDTTPDALTVDMDADEHFGAVNHKFMFNELGEEYSNMLSGIETLKSGGCDFGSLYDKIGHSFAGGEAKKLQKDVRC